MDKAAAGKWWEDVIEGGRIKALWERRSTALGKPIRQWTTRDFHRFFAMAWVMDRNEPLPSPSPRDFGILANMRKEMGPDQLAEFLVNAVANWAAIRYKYGAVKTLKPDLLILMKYRRELITDIKLGGTICATERVSRYQNVFSSNAAARNALLNE